MMAKGNWKPDVIKPRTRCLYCGAVIKSDKVYVDGYQPAHKGCAERRNLNYSCEMERSKSSEIELTDSVTIKVG
jgi:hypothetical protein